MNLLVFINKSLNDRIKIAEYCTSCRIPDWVWWSAVMNCSKHEYLNEWMNGSNWKDPNLSDIAKKKKTIIS